jgi:hypothetical protein
MLENRASRKIGVLLISTVSLLLVLCAAPPAAGQVLYGSLTGNVTDPSGAAMPGARVEAFNVATGVARQVTADSKGVYLFPELLPGTSYKVTISAPGFTTMVTENVRIDANTERRVDAQLAVAPQRQRIEVTGAPPPLQTDRADLRTNVDTTQLTNIPITSSAGRSFQALYRIIPGFGIATELNSGAGNPQRSMTANVNGGSSQDNATRIDGSLDTYIWLPGNVAYVPPADSVAEVNVVTNSYDAEQGMTAGAAAINVVTKSGTNQFHGEAYEFNDNNGIRARNFFNPVGYHKPKDILNQFGGNFGGPIKKNKLFFFGDFERTTRRQFAAKYESIPNPAAIFDSAGDAVFSEVIPAGTDCNATPTAGCIYDPNTGTATGTGRTAFASNTIPASRIDPAAKEMLSLIDTSGYIESGLANSTGGQLANNYYGSHPARFNRNSIDTKINFIPSQKSTLFGRYSISQATFLDTMMLGPAGGDSTGGGQPGSAPSRIQAAGLGGTYSISSNTLIDVNAGYTRQRLGAQGQDIALGQFGVNTLHIPGTNGPDPMQAGIPSFQFGGFWGNLGNANTGSPFLFRDNSYVANTNLSSMHGSHDIRFGFEYTRGDLNHFQPQGGSFQTARGTFEFLGSVTALSATGAPAPNYVNSLAQFLLGLPDEVGKAVQNTDPIGIRWRQFALYLRDRWQASPKLTVSYGLRWEYYPFATADHGGVKIFDPETGDILIGGHGSTPMNDGVDVGQGLFLPRLGLAYRLTSKTVIRAGYGMSADNNDWRFFRNNFPNTTNSDVENSGSKVYPWGPAANLTGASFETLVPYPGLGTGIPSVALPNISSGVVPLPNKVALGGDTVPLDYRRGYFHSYNLTVQREFSGFVGEAAYVGTRGIRAPTNENLNAGPAGAGIAGALMNAEFGESWTTINSFTPLQNTYYDALQTRLTRRFSGGGMVGFVYTWSKAIDGEDNEELNALLWPYPAYYSRNKAIAGFDRTSNVELYGVYQLPFGKTKRWATSGIASRLAGGWEFNWLMTRASGQPMSLTGGGSSLNAYGSTETVDQVGPSTIVGGIGPITGQPACPATTLSCHYFDPSAFTGVPTGQARFGTTGRDILRGPGFFNLDASLFRDFKLTERFKLELRAEEFSLTNTPHFANPGTSWSSGSTTFGVITSTLNLGGQLAGSGGERWLWVAAKVIF